MFIMSSDSNISNYQQGVSGSVGGVSGVSGEDQGTTLQTGYSGKDTISKSQLEALAAMMFLANSPNLPSPSGSNSEAGLAGISATSSKDFMMATTLQIDAIKQNILDSWQKNLEEISQQIKDEINSPQNQAKLYQQSPEYLATVESQSALKGASSFQSYLNSLAPSDRIDQMNANQEYMLRVGLANGLENYNKSSGSDSAAAQAIPFVAAAMIIGPTFIGQFAAKTPAIEAANANTQIQFMQTHFDQFSSLIPPDMRAELGLIGALFATVALNTAGASNLVERAKGGNKATDQELALKSAQNVINLMQNGVLSSFVIGSMVNKMEGSNKLSEERKQELASQVKISLMALAVGALYKSDAKWITGQEFLSLINGDMKLKEIDENGKVTKYLLSKEVVDQLEKLIPLISAELKSLTPAERSKAEKSLAKYMDSNPNFAGFFDVNKSVASLYQSTPAQQISEK